MSEDINLLISRLGTFRPSDRTVLDRHLADESTRLVVVDAVKKFVSIWEQADWLEAFPIERIGRWIAKYQSEVTVAQFEDWCRNHPTEPRQALIKGIELGRIARTDCTQGARC